MNLVTRTPYPTIGIVQGETWTNSFVFAGDVSTWEPRGQIRSKRLQDGGVLLAEFAFESLVYDTEADETTVVATLTPPQTSALQITKYRGVGTPGKTNVYYYDIELESAGGVVVKLAPGAAYVIGEVTGPGVPPAPVERFLTAANNLSDIEDPEEARQNLGIVGGVKSDWDAEPGDSAEILNKPNLSIYIDSDELAIALNDKQDAGDYLTASDLSAYAPKASPIFTGNPRINGVEHFYQTTKPVTRGNGSALAIGDRWWKSDSGTEWFWNGTYWLSTKQLSFTGGSYGEVSAGNKWALEPIPARGGTPFACLIELLSYSFLYNGDPPAPDKYWSIVGRLRTSGLSESPVPFTYNVIFSQLKSIGTIPINTYYVAEDSSMFTLHGYTFGVVLSKTGVFSGGQALNFSYFCREVFQ